MLAVFLGPRSADFLEHDMSCFIRVDSKSDIKWGGWSMTGKGGVEALLPVPDPVVEASRTSGRASIYRPTLLQMNGIFPPWYRILPDFPPVQI